MTSNKTVQPTTFTNFRLLIKKITTNSFLLCGILLLGCNTSNGQRDKDDSGKVIRRDSVANVVKPPPPPPVLDTAAYNRCVMHLVRDSASAKWPVKTPYPLPGALLPFNRIVAYYGNFYSTHMGVLGEYPPDEMLKRLTAEVKKWQAADSTTHVIPAIHYIAVTAQSQPGKEGKYILRMPFAQIDKALEIAKKINAVVFLDVQIGTSTVQHEIPMFEKYLKMPNVHLAIDPEFSMKTGKAPGKVIGTMDAADINFVSDYLAQIVKKNNLPPKVLIVHRFTLGMVTGYKSIKTRPEVQMVMDMDGWGFPAKKVNTYKLTVAGEPLQFTGFKLFYKNDILTPPWKTVMKPEEVLKLYPKPIYIQYQ
jgi:hypothetical protein